MIVNYTTTIGDSGSLRMVLLNDGEPLDLTPATEITLVLRRLRSSSSLQVDLLGSVTDAEAGEITHTWEEGEPDRAGVYSAQIRVEFPSGTVLVPNQRDGGQLWYRFEFLPALV